ncbi:hypothetical protein DYB34_000860 [Aphanomyces astaci]|uniref:Flavodoxin-like domain-containing protein n=3 Tax=Aphanomyces astaci TaxID=112090 RepID=A0A3R6VWW2_APHAT|nr:hypothetical protein DYB34_000860 [Aphanomyces astaci]
MDLTLLLGVDGGGDDSNVQMKYERMQVVLEAINQPAFAFDDADVPTYMHIVSVYTLLVHIVDAPIPPRVIKAHITPSFVSDLLGVIQSQDPRERVMVATVLHNIYAKFKSLRLHIHQQFVHLLMQYVEYGGMGYPYGIPDLLEVLSSIIRGFTTPLQPDHITLLMKTLLPLAKHALVHYHQPLLLCITDFVAKAPTLSSAVVEYLLTHWPHQSTAKQILYLNALEEVLEITPVDCLPQPTKAKITAHLAKCIECVHFQVAERTLFLWNSTQLINHSIFNPRHTRQVLPILFPSLMAAFKTHWHATVRMLAHATAMSLSQFNVHKSTQYSTVIFVVASYGTGGPTDDATSFYNWLKTSLKPDLSHMQYTVFGCGNSDYTDSYNGMAKFVDAKIGAFGATRFFDLSLGDAAGEIDHLDNDYDAWEGRVLDVVAPMATADTTSSTTTTIPATAQFISIVKLSSTALQVDFATDVAYTGTGILALYPQNAKEIVSAVAHRCGYNLDHWVDLVDDKAGGAPASIPLPCTVADALTHYVDLCAVSRTIVSALARIQVSLPALLSIVAPIKPRKYTIASSHLASPNVIQCCISVPEKPLAQLDQHHGTMGACMVSLLPAKLSNPGVRFRGLCQAATMYFPKTHQFPVILIAAGSGQDKQYVQDVVEKHIAAIMTALDSSNAYIYICGKIDMAQAVQTILKRDRGVAWWDEIIATRRYNQEVFG